MKLKNWWLFFMHTLNSDFFFSTRVCRYETRQDLLRFVPKVKIFVWDIRKASSSFNENAFFANYYL